MEEIPSVVPVRWIWPRQDNRILSPTNYIFNHFPKTGGTSLMTVFRCNLAAEEISPHLEDREIRLMPPAQLEKYRLLTGHFGVLTQAGFSRSRYTITMLRDPIKTLFSAYTFWRITREDNFLTSKAKELSFTDFVHYFKDSPTIIHNPFTYHFAAVGKDWPAYPADTTGLLETAKHNLAAFDFVGICEELTQSMQLLCRELGWRCPVEIPHENRSFSENWFGGIEPEIMEILRDRTQLDSELYTYAVQLFHARETGVTKRYIAFSQSVERNRFVALPEPLRRYRRAVIQCVSANWIPDESSKILEITVNFKTIAPIAELCLGVQVVDPAGNIVWGTNTTNERQTLDYEVGRDSHAAFLLECDLCPGNYSVTIAVHEPQRHGFHEHWIDRAAFFTVTSPRIPTWLNVQGAQLRQFTSSSR